MTSSRVDNLAKAFSTGFSGQVVVPGSPTYDACRSVWNATVDRCPQVIARCRRPDEIVAAIRICREAGVAPAIRAGGHSVAGLSMSDGVVIDLRPMSGIDLDTDARVARVGAGATWHDFDAAGAAHGLATTGGLISSTGVAGLTLGGGIGWLQRKHGLSCDNLIGATLATATAKSSSAMRTASRTSSGGCGEVAATSGWSPSLCSGCTRSTTCSAA